MTCTVQRFLTIAHTLVALVATAPSAGAATVVTLEVPALASAGSAKSFQFVSFQFNVDLAPLGDCPSDYCANVLANDRENYTYLAPVSCAARYCPPSYVRTAANTYSAAYQRVTSPPDQIDAIFHFSADDVIGQPLVFSVQGGGNYTLTLTEDATNAPVAPGTPLSGGAYTLQFSTDNLEGAEVLVTAIPAPPAVALVFAPGLFVWAAIRRRAGAR